MPASIIPLFHFIRAFVNQRQPLSRQLEAMPLGYRYWQDLCLTSEYIQVAIPEQAADFLLKIRLPTLTPCPKPPQPLHDWLSPHWYDWRTEAAYLPERMLEQHLVLFSDDSERVTAWQTWLLQRQSWQQLEQRQDGVRQLFSFFQVIHTELQKQTEALDLVLGCALVKDNSSLKKYNYPLIIKQLQLLFNVKNNEFILTERDTDSEIQFALCYELTENAHHLAQTWEHYHPHPLSEEGRHFSQTLATWLQPHRTDLTVHYQPVVFVRPRPSGALARVNHIIQQLEQQPNLPVPTYLQRLAGLAGSEPNPSPTIKPILLALPANAEQYQLAEQLEQHDIVLVQGPPGTGKTHTIANLIGHLLADQKRILVTSHSSKALRVLRDKVPEGIRSLCVSLLDNDQHSRQELAQAIDALSQHLAQAPQLQQQAERLKTQYQALQQQVTQLKHQQMLSLRREYDGIILAGHSTPPSEAARWVKQYANEHGWLPALAEHELGKPCPLSPADVRWLYASQDVISSSHEQEFSAGLPNLHDLPQPHDWQKTLHALDQQLAAAQRETWWWPQLGSVVISQLTEALPAAEQIQRSLQELYQHADWLAQLIEFGLTNDDYFESWQPLFELILEYQKLEKSYQNSILEYDPKLETSLIYAENTLSLLDELSQHLANKGHLSWWSLLTNNRWKPLLQSARCNGQTMSRLEHVQAVRAYVHLHQQQQRLQRRWQRQVTVLGGVALADDNPLRTALQWLPHIQLALTWGAEQWQPFSARYLRLFDVSAEQLESRIPPVINSATPRLHRIQRLLNKELIPEWQAHLARHQAEQITANIEQCEHRLQQLAPHHPTQGVVNQLLQALEHRDWHAYQYAYQHLQQLHVLYEHYQRRQQLLQQLHRGAQHWAEVIKQRQLLHDRALSANQDIALAWQWRQWHDELERRAQLDSDAIARQLAQAQEQLQRTTAQWITVRSWAHQALAAEPYRPHLVGWQQTQVKLGKGTGKQAAHLRQQAQQQLKQAQYAVPVWIMPLAEVFRSLPVDSQFDVVIVDEASQVDLSGLLATWLGRKVLIVGDDEQVSPDAVGHDSAQIQLWQDQYLTHFPNRHLYDAQTSLYDLTKQVARGQLCLQEHFRSVPAIIGFSNQLSYHGRIKALREPASSTLQAPVVPYRVQGQRQADKTNPIEAQTIVKLVQAMCQHPAYADKTLGVISLLGYEQAILIEQLLRQALSASELEQRRLLCGNAAQFQGDERDVILLSMVDSNETEGPLRLQGDGARDLMKKRYNVACSRARDQLWIIHSLDYLTDLKADDLRHRLLSYAHNTQQLSSVNTATESPFEAAVLAALQQRGYQVLSQYAVGYYRIDLVVVGQQARLAVECDGDRFHSSSEQISQDLARQAVLERLGWTFYRLRGSAFYRNAEHALAGLWQKLAELNIHPISQPVNLDTESLHAEIIRLAAYQETSEQEASEALNA